MIIKKCYIENFGKFHEFYYEFDDKINTIIGENGWGKTTFAVFIKAMFYGLECDIRKKVSDNERKKYLPWQGGRYGGNIEFVIEGKGYKIERFFDPRGREDTFALCDLETGNISDEFSENIGEEIFKIDRESYERSTYIPQNAISVTVTDSISAKMSNMVENVNDISNSDSAIEILEARKMEYRKPGAKGRIPELEQKIQNKSAELEDCINKEKRIYEIEDKIQEQIVQKRKYFRIKFELKDEILKAGTFMEKQAKAEHYAMLCRQALITSEKLDELDYFFKKGIPEEDEIKRISEETKKITEYNKIIEENPLEEGDDNRLNFLQEFFETGIPDREELDECRKLIEEKSLYETKLSSYKFGSEDIEKLDSLKAFFINKMPREGEIDQYLEDYNKVSEIESNIASSKARIDMLKTVDNVIAESEVSKKRGEENNYSHDKNLLIAGIAAIIIGIIGLFVHIYPFTMLIVTGVFLICSALIIKQRKNGNNKEQYREETELEKTRRELLTWINKKQNIESRYINFINKFPIHDAQSNIPKTLSEIKSKYSEFKSLNDRYEESEKNRKEIIGLQAQVILKAEKVLKFFCKKAGTEDYSKLLPIVSDYREEFYELGEKLKKNRTASRSLKQLEKEVTGFLLRFYDDLAASYEELLQEIRDSRNSYIKLKTDMIKWKKEKQDFEEENDIDINQLDNIGAEPVKSLEELQKDERRNDIKISEIDNLINSYRKDVDELTVIAYMRSDIENELEHLQNEKEECEHNYSTLQKTIKYMTEAKERFTSRYMHSMRSSFEKYVKAIDIDGIDPKNLKMDVKLGVSMENNGEMRSGAYMSTGYRDFVGICTRLALIDSLYNYEKPFIILDDPFVNFDEKKLKNALELLKKASDKYQIIYFVCHSGRAL